jgi:hypothetical protein
MEWVSKLFDIGKLPAKVIAWVAILSGMVLFLPASALATLHLDAFSRDYGVWIGLAFVASSTGTPTEADRQRILNSRPAFMRRLADLDWLRNG